MTIESQTSVFTIDPFTIAIVEGALVSASDEMFAAIKHASYSPIIYEVLDYASGMTDACGRLVVQGNGVTGFLGSLSSAVQALIERGDPVSEGDIFVVNDPYGAGGSHLSDVTVLRPFFAEGELLAFGASKAHWTEIGGARPGSWSNDAVDVYAEGLHFPLMKLGDRNGLNSTILTLLESNVRTPVETMGDLYAQLGALVIGERRLQDIVHQYGLDAVRTTMDEMILRGERAAKRMLQKLPKGEFFAEDFLDTDGTEDDQPVYVCVRIRVTEDEFVADFTGSSPAVASTINATWPSLECGVRTTFRALIDTEEPTSDGMFVPLRIVCPPGTVFTAQRPTPVSTYWESSDMAADLVHKALAPHLGGRLPAGHSLSVCGAILAFDLRPGETTQHILVEPQGGGWGGSTEQDGESALVPIGDGDTCSIPVEILESTYPVLVEAYQLNLNSEGGAGKYRGGYGIVRTMTLLQSASLTSSFGRNRFPAWGIAGGHNGTPNYVEVTDITGKTLVKAGRLNHLRLPAGTKVSFVTGVGGGYGDPTERDAQRVIDDLNNELISYEVAKTTYGYRMEVDQEAQK